MKVFILCLTFFLSTAFAEEVVLTSFPKKEIWKANSSDSIFLIDFDRGEVYGKMEFNNAEHWCYHTPNGGIDCYNVVHVVKTVKEKIPNLSLTDDQVIFEGQNGPVVCGVVKSGRVFHNARKLVLNGSCILSKREAGDMVEVIFTSK